MITLVIYCDYYTNIVVFFTMNYWRTKEINSNILTMCEVNLGVCDIRNGENYQCALICYEMLMC